MDEIKKLSPADRLGLYSAILEMNKALYQSIKGWSNWLMAPAFINTFNEEELQEIYSSFKDFTLKFLEVDIKWTDKKERKREEKPETGERSAPQFLWG